MSAPESITPSNSKLKGLCDAHVAKYNPDPCYYSPSKVAFLTSTINSHGVGMTTLGMALQCFVLFSALFMFFVVIGPGLAILTEWPAQWIGLAMELPAGDVKAAVAGTSVGRHCSDCIGLDWTGFKLKSSPSNSFRIWLLELQGNPMQIYTNLMQK